MRLAVHRYGKGRSVLNLKGPESIVFIVGAAIFADGLLSEIKIIPTSGLTRQIDLHVTTHVQSRANQLLALTDRAFGAGPPST